MPPITMHQPGEVQQAIWGSYGPMDSFFRGTDFNGSVHPEDQNMKRAMQANGYAFGLPNNTEYSSDNDVWYPTYNLREAYRGKTVFLGTLITGLAYYDNNDYILQEPDGLPLVLTNEQHWRWDEVLFDIPYVDVVMHEGPFRHVRSRKQSGQAGTQRRGLGIDIEHDWFEHPLGRIQFGRHVQQVKNGWLYTIALGAYRALSNARPVHIEYLRKSGLLEQYSIYELHMQKARMSFEFMKHHQGARTVINRVQDALYNRRKTALSTIHMDSVFAGQYFRGAGIKNQEYQYAGDRANKWYYGNPSKVKSVPGEDIRIRIANFSDDNNMESPLRRNQVTGEFYTMFGVPTNRFDPVEYRTFQRDIRIFNYDTNSMETITLRDLLDNSMLFAPDGSLLPSDSRGKYDNSKLDVNDLFKNSSGTGIAQKFGQLNPAVLPSHLLRAMARSVIAKRAAGISMQEVFKDGIKIEVKKHHERFFIGGQAKQVINPNAYYHGAIISRASSSPSSTETGKQSASLSGPEADERVMRMLSEENRQLYTQITGRITSSTTKTKLSNSLLNHPKDGTTAEVSIGATLKGIAGIVSTARFAQTELNAAIEKIPQVAQTATTPEPVSEPVSTERAVQSVGVFPGHQIISSDHDFCPINYSGEPTDRLASSEVTPNSVAHDILSSKTSIGYPLKDAEDSNATVGNLSALGNAKFKDSLADPTEQIVIDAFLDLDINKKVFDFLLDNDILFPFGGLVFRPFMSFVTATALMGSFGRATGFSPMSDIDVMWGDDPDVKRHTMNMSGYVTSIVVNPETYMVMDDLFIIRPTGGYTTRWMNASSVASLMSNRLRQVKNGDRSRASIFGLLTVYRFKIKECVDMRGRFTPCSGVPATVDNDDVHFITHIPPALHSLLGAKDLTTRDPYGNGRGYNSICYVGTHYAYNPETRRLDGVIQGKGWLGANIKDGSRTILDSGGVLEDCGYANMALPF